MKTCHICGIELGRNKQKYCENCGKEMKYIGSQRYFTVISLRRKLYILLRLDPHEALDVWDSMVEVEGEEFTEYAFGNDLKNKISKLRSDIDGENH